MPTSIKETAHSIVAQDYTYHHPAISILLPFDTVVTKRDQLLDKVNSVIAHVKAELMKKYPAAKVTPIMQQLESAVSALNFDTTKKAIAIFVSPLYSKLLYLDAPVTEKVVIDEPYEIRDLIYSEHNLPKYLILVICARHFKVLVGNDHELKEIKVTIPDHVIDYTNDIAERVTNFSDISDRKEVMLDKFLHHIDEEVTNIRKNYPLPIIVLGAKRTAGHYTKISHNTKDIVEYVHGNYDESTIPELSQLLQPHFATLEKGEQNNILKQFAEAVNANKLAWGIHEVWRYAMQNKGKLLVIEKTYHYPSNESGPIIDISESKLRVADPSYIRDGVDVIIEKVLESGGRVEFVDKGLLDSYEQIALIQYY